MCGPSCNEVRVTPAPTQDAGASVDAGATVVDAGAPSPARDAGAPAVNTTCVAPLASDGSPRFVAYAQSPGAVYDRNTGLAWWPTPATLPGDAGLNAGAWLEACEALWPNSFPPTVNDLDTLLLPSNPTCDPDIDQSVFPNAPEGNYVVMSYEGNNPTAGVTGVGTMCLEYAAACPADLPLVGVLCMQ